MLRSGFIEAEAKAHGQNACVGSHHQSNQHFGLAEGGNHGIGGGQQPLHSPCCSGYGPASAAALSQLLMAPALITVPTPAIRALDLAPLAPWFSLDPAELISRGAAPEQQLQLVFDWPREPDDPRELSELPELRLWALRADAAYPWLPLVLERSSGQLTRHVAMLVPHGFQATEGIRFAPEAVELWLTHRLFVLDDWARSQGLNCRQSLGQMAAVLGLELDPGFWDALDPA